MWGGCSTLKYLVVLHVYTARLTTAAHVVQLMKTFAHFARVPSICNSLTVDDSEKRRNVFFSLILPPSVPTAVTEHLGCCFSSYGHLES